MVAKDGRTWFLDFRYWMHIYYNYAGILNSSTQGAEKLITQINEWSCIQHLKPIQALHFQIDISIVHNPAEQLSAGSKCVYGHQGGRVVAGIEGQIQAIHR